MDSSLIWTNLTTISITIASLLVFYCSAVYVTRKDGLDKSLINCFNGFLCMELSDISTICAEELPHLLNLFVLLELTLLVVSLCFFISCATSLILRKKASYAAIINIGVIGILFSAMFIYVFPDGVMVAKIRLLVPLAGFVFLSIGFFSRYTKKTISYMILGSLMITIAIKYAAAIAGFGILDYKWLMPVTYTLIGVLFLFLHSEELRIEIKSIKKTLIDNNNKIKEIINHSPFPILISRLSDDKIMLANDNAQRLFGIYRDDVEKYRLKDFFADQSARKKLSESLEGGFGIKDFEFLADAPGAISPFWLLSSASVIEYEATPVLYMALQDITSRKNKESILEDQATKDPLTGIYNRRYFEQAVAEKITNLVRVKSPYSILMLDADHFKNVNDTYGHKSGDNVLIALANIAEKAVRDSDVVARFGGEEFVIFLSDTQEDKAQSVANRLRESISKMVVKSDDNQDITFTASIGVSSSLHSKKVDELIKFADLALYKAKENGRNRVEVYTKECDADAQKLANKKESHHPVYDLESLEEISLIDESNKK